jgi:YHS domain-containing protein
MGGAINKDIFTEYKGKKVYFCCPGCVDRFKADPEKYLAKLPQFNQ